MKLFCGDSHSFWDLKISFFKLTILIFDDIRDLKISFFIFDDVWDLKISFFKLKILIFDDIRGLKISVFKLTILFLMTSET